MDLQGGTLIASGTFAKEYLTLPLPGIIAIYDEDSNFLYHTSSRDNESTSIHDRAWVEFTPDAAGTYYISAGDLSAGTGSYELRVIDITEDPDGHTANRGTAGTVTVGGSVTGKIDFSQDVDWLKLATLSIGTYQVDLEGQAAGRGSLYDPYLRGIFDADGNEIPGTRDDDDGEGSNARVTFRVDTRDTYFIAAGAFGNHEGTYTLSVDEADAM